MSTSNTLQTLTPEEREERKVAAAARRIETQTNQDTKRAEAEARKLAVAAKKAEAEAAKKAKKEKADAEREIRFQEHKKKKETRQVLTTCLLVIGTILVGPALWEFAQRESHPLLNLGSLAGIGAVVVGILCAIPHLIAYLGMYPLRILLGIIALGTFWYLA